MATGRLITAGTTRGAARALPRFGAGWRQLLPTVPLLAYAFAIPFISETDPDYWWHVRTGQVIAETGSVPRADEYSFMIAGQPWISHEWLTDLLIYGLERGVGYGGVAAFFGLVAALTLVLVHRTCQWYGAGPILSAFACAWALLMMQPSLNARPQVLTMLLLALFVFLLTRYRGGEGWALWPLPPLMALWVNLHGGYLIGLVFLGLAVAGEGLRWYFERRHPLPWRLLGTAVLAAFASLLTPHGLDALRYPLTYLGRENASLQFVAEWRSPDFHQALFLPFAASLLLGLALGLRPALSGPTPTLWALTVAYMGLQSVRHIPLYAIVATPLLVARLGAALDALPRVSARARALAQFGARVVVILLPLLLLAGGIAANGAAGRGWQVGQAPSAVGYPSAGAEYLRAHTSEVRLFNEWHWGGYLIAELYPARRVFIDGRADPYGDALVARYRDTILARPGWQQRLDDWQIDLVLVGKDGPLATALRDDPAWREVLIGEVERLFVRRKS